MRLNQKTAIITGGAQGIGKYIAHTFLKEGAFISICDINESILKETINEFEKNFPGKTHYGVCDVRESSSVKSYVESVINKFGKIDILVNNAGVTKDNLLIRMSDEEWNFVIDINLKGVFNFSREVAKYMIKQRSGRIINISSVIGLMGNPGQTNYAASKAGVIGITKTLAKELASRNILVNAVAPGYIQTAMTEKLPEEVKKKLLDYIPLKSLGTPQDVANCVLFLASDESRYITGEVISVNGGMYM